MSLEAWGDENPDDRHHDRLIEDGWLSPDEANDYMTAIMVAAPSHQGGKSRSGQYLAEVIGCPFPITMGGLERRAKEMKMDPDYLWPWRQNKSDN